MTRKRNTTCAVCRHVDCEVIEAQRAAGQTIDALEAKFGVNRFSIWRHWKNHVSAERKTAFLAGPAAIAMLREAAAKENGSLLDNLSITRSVLMGQMVQQAEMGNAFQVANVAAKLIDALKEIGRLTGEISRLNPSITINNNQTLILNSPVFVDMQLSMLRELAPFPEARSAVAALFRRKEREYGSPEPKTIAMAAAE